MVGGVKDSPPPHPPGRERLTAMAHAWLKRELVPGDCGFDGTAGNGYDTEFLARAVGPAGRVFACDLQACALEITSRRLAVAGLKNVELIEGDHARVAEFVPRGLHGRLAALVFNLGYLPGGDKARTTQADSTLRAIQSGLPLLRVGGVLSVIAYRGHPGGEREAQAVEQALRALSPRPHGLERCLQPGEHPTAPRWFALRRGVVDRP